MKTSRYSRQKVAKAVVAMLEAHGLEAAAAALADVLASGVIKLDVDLLIRDIGRIIEKKHRVANISLESARELPESLMKHVQAYLERLTGATDSVVNTTINPKLIGGLRTQTADQELDWSIAGKLSDLKRGGA